ncbi:hypothetical protein ACFL0M_07150 [Thermodesulfobacteriota bacterium]
MSNKKIEGWKLQFPKEKPIFVATNVKSIHPVVDKIVVNLCGIDLIQYVRVSQDYLQASSEIKVKGRIKVPVTAPGHPTAVGVYLLLDFPDNSIQFFEITSSAKGYGKKIVRAVITAIPDNWKAAVVMDWSEGFWERMAEKYENIVIL